MVLYRLSTWLYVPQPGPKLREYNWLFILKINYSNLYVWMKCQKCNLPVKKSSGPRYRLQVRFVSPENNYIKLFLATNTLLWKSKCLIKSMNDDQVLQLIITFLLTGLIINCLIVSSLLITVYLYSTRTMHKIHSYQKEKRCYMPDYR